MSCCADKLLGFMHTDTTGTTSCLICHGQMCKDCGHMSHDPNDWIVNSPGFTMTDDEMRSNHYGIGCEEVASNIASELTPADIATYNTIRHTCVECPVCRANVQKSGGCDRMKCTQCDTHFCIRCGYIGASEVAPGSSSSVRSSAVYDHLSHRTTNGITPCAKGHGIYPDNVEV
jgi:hypothetical protein